MLPRLVVAAAWGGRRGLPEHAWLWRCRTGCSLGWLSVRIRVAGLAWPLIKLCIICSHWPCISCSNKDRILKHTVSDYCPNDKRSSHTAAVAHECQTYADRFIRHLRSKMSNMGGWPIKPEDMRPDARCGTAGHAAQHVHKYLHSTLKLYSRSTPVLLCHALRLVLGQGNLQLQQRAAQLVVHRHHLPLLLYCLQEQCSVTNIC